MTEEFRAYFVKFPEEGYFLIFKDKKWYNRFLYLLTYEVKKRLSSSKSGDINKNNMMGSILMYDRTRTRFTYVLSKISDVESDENNIYFTGKMSLFGADSTYWTPKQDVINCSLLIDKIVSDLKEKYKNISTRRIPFFMIVVIGILITILFLVIFVLNLFSSETIVNIIIFVASLLGISMIFYGLLADRKVKQEYNNLKI